MDEKKTIEKHWKKYKERRSNGILLLVYCLLFVGIGAIFLLGGIGEKQMYDVLKDDDYLTDDGLAYRDMVNATYTYPLKDIEGMAKSSGWMMALGCMVMAASLILALSVAWILPEQTEIHAMLCRQWQNETYAGKDGPKEMEYCPECGLKLSKLDKK